MDNVEADRAAYMSVREMPHKDLLVYAAKATGRSPLQIQREFGQLSKSGGALSFAEYVRLGLHHADRFSEEERARFLGNKLHWTITDQCNDKRWEAVAEDKVLAGLVMNEGGVRTPESVAVIDMSARTYPGLPKINSAEGVARLLKDFDGQKLFCKIVDGMVSFGAFQIEGGDAEHIHCSGQDPMSHEAFLKDFVGDSAYLVQKVISNHSKIADYAPAVGTVRVVTLLTEDGVYTPAAAIKLPQGDNLADAFWRPGNIACDIDVKTGRICSVSRRDIEMEYLEDHPEKPGLIGLELPFWSELLEMNEKAASLFAPMPYQSTDIAITEDGPVVVELNYGGGFDLPQFASGRGILTPEVRAFFEGHGVDFNPKKKSWFFGRRG